MKLDELYECIELFSRETHGSTNYYKEEVFVRGHKPQQYAPISYLKKKLSTFDSANQLIRKGFVYVSFDLSSDSHFKRFYEEKFSRKFNRTQAKKTHFISLPDNRSIFDSIDLIDKNYEVLRQADILLNGKNLPVQLGEWYAKCIFGLRQLKSTSQRGFDFYLDSERVEIKVEWSDQSSPKGAKLRKSLLDLSKYTIIIFLAANFRIRDLCFLDSSFVLRKFYTKGHFLFLKDADLSGYYYSKGNKHLDKVINPTSLLKFSTPTLAVKISEKFSH